MTTPLRLETGMLSFERSIQTSEALMFAERADGTSSPVVVTEKGVRGQSYNHVDPQERDTKTKGKPGEGNLQEIETAIMPDGTHALSIRFSVRILPGSAKPHACNLAQVGQSYRALSERYAQSGGYLRLAERYVWNLCNGGFAWRNAFHVDHARVTLTWGSADDQTITLHDIHNISKDTVVGIDAIAGITGIFGSVLAEDGAQRLHDLCESFATSLYDRSAPPLIIKVVWTGDTQPGQEVFPSQEYLSEQRQAMTSKARVLAKVGPDNQASIHSQKIGAALRRIDDWHGDEQYGAIVVNAYSGVQETGAVLRKGRSFYEMRAETEDLFADERRDELDFIMANLIRGGVFGVANPEKAEKKRQEQAAKLAKKAKGGA